MSATEASHASEEASTGASSGSTNVCNTPGCGKPSKMRCPTCKKLGIPGGYFCEQECFKNYWPSHKVLHKKFKDAVKQYQNSAMMDDKTARRMRKGTFEDYEFTGPLRPGNVSTQLTVPDHIGKPDYAEDSIPDGELALRGSTKIHTNSEEEIAIMREAGRIAREVLEAGANQLKVGATGDDVDKAVFNACMEKNVYPSPLNYHGFPKSVCVSTNEVICHGIPDDRPFQDGDIVNLDITIYHKGHHADLNETFFIGNVDEESRRLVRTAFESLSEATKLIRPGTMYRQLGQAITKITNHERFSVVKSYCGHGVNQLFHTTPSVPHYARNKAVGIMRPGHTFTIEPMINAGTPHDALWPDQWTAVTVDGKRSAQFEHSFLVTEDGVEILTARPGDPRDHMVWSEDYLQR
eukprot:gb/GECG01008963.1/.p1 GENE.gb/GECG01008963.1/~~gb/GECG01008963.1/.p1  ORF type:complete len:408 (+),score=44.82 gb/GECG01008963.1/:1-1224(+)